MDALAPLVERGERKESGGSIAAALVAYLSGRMDLLSEAEALENSERPELTTVTPFHAVDELFHAESGLRLDQAFDRFEAEPFDTGPLLQWHRARLNGEPVVFKVVQPEFASLLEGNLGGLPELESIVGRLEVGQRELALADFGDHLARSLDLSREARDLVDLGERCESMSLVTVPGVRLELSGARFLTVADLAGSTPEERARTVADGPRLARRLCRAWLRLVVSAATVPMSPRGRNVLFLDDGKVAFGGGPFYPLSGHARDLLRSYLTAATVEDNESLADAFLELSHGRGVKEERRLRHKLRHTAPFRDGGWNPESDSLSRALLAHWYQAEALGFRPRRPLQTFFTGLALLTREARMLAPGESSFREAFQELRLYELFSESARLASGGEIAPMADLPRKLDRGLTLAAAEARRKSERAADGRGGSWSVVAALFMAIAAVVLMVHHVAPAAGAPAWIETSGAVLVLVLGGFLLRLAAE